jgi:N6-L-threonylcarbamoyladenine synthase
MRHIETRNLTPVVEQRRKGLAIITKPRLEDYLAVCDTETRNLVASFQRAMVEDLVDKTLKAADAFNAATLFVTGGVAANNELRSRFEEAAAHQGLPVFFPSRPLSTDNAAMIAAAAYPKWLAKDFAPMEFSAEASLTLKKL